MKTPSGTSLQEFRDRALFHSRNLMLVSSSLVAILLVTGCSDLNLLGFNKLKANNVDLGTTQAQVSSLDLSGTVVAKVAVPAGVTVQSASISKPSLRGGIKSLSAANTSVTVDDEGYISFVGDPSGIPDGTYTLPYSVTLSDGSEGTGEVELFLSRGAPAVPKVWGAEDSDHSLRLNSTTGVYMTPQTMTDLSLTFKEMSVSANHACGLTSDGVAHCWGSGANGRLGNGSTTGTVLTGPIPIGGNLRFRSISAANNEWNRSDIAMHTCAIAIDGTAYCWGSGADGRLGTGNTADSLVPVPVLSSVKFASVKAGPRYTCALDFESKMYCWGSGVNGRLGNGDSSNRLVPTLVNSTEKFVSMATAAQGTCGITSAGKLLCWGYKPSAAGAYLLNPTEPMPGKKFLSVVGDASSMCMIDSINDGYCWGHAMFGRLGIGNWDPVGLTFTMGISFFDEIYSPLPIAGGHKFKKLSAGKNSACGIDLTNKLYCWGSNNGGELGIGHASPGNYPEGAYGAYSPMPIDAASDYSSVDVVSDTAFALTKPF